MILLILRENFGVLYCGYCLYFKYSGVRYCCGHCRSSHTASTGSISAVSTLMLRVLVLILIVYEYSQYSQVFIINNSNWYELQQYQYHSNTLSPARCECRAAVYLPTSTAEYGGLALRYVVGSLPV